MILELYVFLAAVVFIGGYIAISQKSPIYGAMDTILAFYLAWTGMSIQINTACCTTTQSYIGLQIFFALYGLSMLIFSILGYIDTQTGESNQASIEAQ